MLSEWHRLFASVSWLSFGNVLSRALALVTMPLLTTWLSPEAYGEAALIGTLVSLCSVVALAGIDTGYARHYFSAGGCSTSEVEAYCWRWAIGLSVSVSVIATWAWVLLLSPWIGVNLNLFPFVGLGVCTSALATMAQGRARLLNRYRAVSAAQLAGAASSAAVSLSIAYVFQRQPYALLAAMLVGYSLPILLLGWPPLSELRRPAKLTPSARRSLISVGLPGLLTAPAFWVVGSSDRWFLAHYANKAEVGVYSIASTVGTIGLAVSMAISAAWLPELARAESKSAPGKSEKQRELVQLLLALLLIAWISVVASGGDLIRLLGDHRFHAAAELVPWLATGILFYGAMHVGNTLLILLGKFYWSACIWMAGALLSLALNFALVPLWGTTGAAIAQLTCFTVTSALVWFVVLRNQAVDLHLSPIAIAVFVASTASILMQGAWSNSPIASLLAKLPVGLLSAWLVIYYLARAPINSMIKRRDS